MPIDARKSHEDIVAELIREYKDSGKIGNTEPDDMAHAQKIANAIAYSEKEKGKKKAKVEALERHIKSLIRPENAAFLEGVVMEGFKACFESDDLESDEIIRMDTDSMTADEIDVVQTQLDELKVEKADVEEKEEDIAEKEEALKNSAATFSLNDDTLTEAKSAGASKVLQLMDSDYSYQKALGKVLADNPDLDKTTLEKELDAYL